MRDLCESCSSPGLCSAFKCLRIMKSRIRSCWNSAHSGQKWRNQSQTHVYLNTRVFWRKTQIFHARWTLYRPVTVCHANSSIPLDPVHTVTCCSHGYRWRLLGWPVYEESITTEAVLIVSGDVSGLIWMIIIFILMFNHVIFGQPCQIKEDDCYYYYFCTHI